MEIRRNRMGPMVVSAAMPNRRATVLVTAALVATTVLSACGLISSLPGLGAGGSAPGAVAPGAPDAAPPGAPGTKPGGGSAGNPGGGGAGGGVDGGAPGLGSDLPISGPGGGNGLVGNNPTLVTVHPGQAGLRDVNPVELRAIVDAEHHVIVRVRWWGGIEPCEVLDSVAVTRDGSSFTIAARVGSPEGGQFVCIEIARDTATLVDLGVLPAGRYTVRASAGALPPISVTVP